MQRRQIAGPDRNCCILVVSCDRYRDLWTPFFTLFKRYWPDCNMPVYLGTNCAHADVAGVTILNAGEDEAWSRRLRYFLQTIDTSYVLVMLEDFFLDRRVSNAEILRQIELLQRLDGVALRLFPNPPADYFLDGVGILHVQSPYRVSLQAAIWNRRRLMDLLVDEESPWEFERRGSKRSRALSGGFYSVAKAVIHYQHVVERGEWFRSCARRYGAEDIGCDFKARPVMGILKTCKKKPANLLRRAVTKAHSRWICIRYPERLPDAR